MSGILVLSRHGGNDAVRHDRETDLLERATQAGATVWLVGHLYHIPEDCSLWSELSALPGPLVVASWLHARPLEALLRKHGVWRDDFLAVDLADDPAVSWTIMASRFGITDASPPVERNIPTANRWYPLVDPALCVHCQQCLQFCLFGVYDRDKDGRVRVARPDACKAGCPACSRICPQGAIMFPLYKDPAIAGAPGLRMQLDAAGKALFFNRTGKACPTCGVAAKADPGQAGPICPTCGRHTQMPASRPADAIDQLIDDLDRIQKRR